MKTRFDSPWGAVVVLALVLGGCAAPPRPNVLAHLAPKGQQPVALLPVQAADVRVTLAEPTTFNEITVGLFTKSQESAVRTATAILDGLGKRGGAVTGPSIAASALGPEECARLVVYLNDPGPPTEAWKQQGLAEIAGRLGVTALVRTRITVRYTEAIGVPADLSVGPGSASVAATITVELDEIDARSGRIVGHGRGESIYRSTSRVAGATSAAAATVVPSLPVGPFTESVMLAVHTAWRALQAPPVAADQP